MESVGDEKPWAVDQRRAYGLRVVLPKRTYVLPWAQFLYAEGAPDTVRAVFSMHDVVVTVREQEGCWRILPPKSSRSCSRHEPNTSRPRPVRASWRWRSAELRGVGPNRRKGRMNDECLAPAGSVLRRRCESGQGRPRSIEQRDPADGMFQNGYTTPERNAGHRWPAVAVAPVAAPKNDQPAGSPSRYCTPAQRKSFRPSLQSAGRVLSRTAPRCG
jgi:hypothetical protein